MANSSAVQRDRRLLLLNAADNVLIARSSISPGEDIMVEGTPVQRHDPIQLGHKLARQAIAAGDPIVKYGMPIGYATEAIAPGAHVHLHNVRSGYTRSIALTTGRDVDV